MSRTFAEHDRVAVRDRVGQPWKLGTVTGHTADGWLIIDRGHRTTDIRHPDDVRVQPADQVPIDERHWLPEPERDQLVRQEAAARLREMSEWLVGVGMNTEAIYMDKVAFRLDDLLAPAPLHLARAARDLLAPAPQPATTP